MKLKIKTEVFCLSTLITIVSLLVFILLCSASYADVKQAKCLSQVNSISQQIFNVYIFNSIIEAENFANNNYGIILKESGKEIYQVFISKDLLFCPGQTFIWID